VQEKGISKKQVIEDYLRELLKETEKEKRAPKDTGA